MTKYLKSQFTCIYPSAARILHVKGCGMHHNTTECTDIQRNYESYKNLSQKYKENLFPKKLLEPDKSLFINHTYDTSNGGWSDYRDHLLCKSFINKKYLNTLKKKGIIFWIYFNKTFKHQLFMHAFQASSLDFHSLCEWE